VVCRKINKIGIIGAGNMGSGIAQKIIQEGLPAVMVDVKEAFVERGLANIKNTLAEAVERKIFSTAQVDEILARITATTDFNAVADADIVIEAVFEDKQVKAEVFKNSIEFAMKRPSLPPTHPLFTCASSQR
jgi:enoyl-CoA hydratase/3-hydroxyacyl-CoA dehydrogenase